MGAELPETPFLSAHQPSQRAAQSEVPGSPSMAAPVPHGGERLGHMAAGPQVPLTVGVQTVQVPPPTSAHNPVLTQDNIVTLALVCGVIVFYATEQIVKFVVARTTEAAETANVSNGAQVCRYSRIASASVVLRFSSILVTVAVALTLALGLMKAFAAMASLVLPDRAFGLIVLISYCGLVAVCKVLLEELKDGLKKLLAPLFQK